MPMYKCNRRNLDLRYRISEDQRKEIFRRRIAGDTQASLAADFNVHQSTISRIVEEQIRLNDEEGQDNE